MERHSMFVQTDDAYFYDTALNRNPSTPTTSTSLPGKLALPSSQPSTNEPSTISTPSSPQDNIHLRRERQTFTPLPQATTATGRKHALFTVHTFLTPLKSLSNAELDAFIDIVQNWNEDTVRYKGRDVWMEAVLKERDGRVKKTSY